MSLSSITAIVRSKGVACPKCLTPVRNEVEINLVQKSLFSSQKQQMLIPKSSMHFYCEKMTIDLIKTTRK